MGISAIGMSLIAMCAAWPSCARQAYPLPTRDMARSAHWSAMPQSRRRMVTPGMLMAFGPTQWRYSAYPPARQTLLFSHSSHVSAPPRRRSDAAGHPFAPHPRANVPNRRRNQSHRACVDQLSCGKSMDENDASDESNPGEKRNEERTRASVRPATPPHAPEGHEQGHDHQGPQDRVRAQEAQANGCQRGHNERNTEATERREDRGERCSPVSDSFSLGRHAAQQESFATSLLKAWAASLIPSDNVRYG